MFILHLENAPQCRIGWSVNLESFEAVGFRNCTVPQCDVYQKTLVAGFIKGKNLPAVTASSPGDLLEAPYLAKLLKL